MCQTEIMRGGTKENLLRENLRQEVSGCECNDDYDYEEVAYRLIGSEGCDGNDDYDSNPMSY